jgi:phasin family protein
MAQKPTAAKTARKSAKRTRKSPARARKAAAAPSAGAGAEMMDKTMAEMEKMAKLMTPEQAIELYKANARMALEVINAAIDSTAKMRKLQFEGEETAREFGRRTARGAAEARDPQTLMAVSHEAGREAVEKSLAYWGEMFDLIVEMQKRLFNLMEDQADGVPGFRQARAAMAMMPDLGPMKNVVSAMQGMIGSGTGAFGSMQKMMADMARMAGASMPGARR